MKTVDTVVELREQIDAWRRQGERIAFVPTMGNLHAGHLKLVTRAFELADRVVASIFVNPLQFAPGEDFARYPRTLESDTEKLRVLGTDLLFAPDVDVMYPGGTGAATTITVPEISDILCGEFRPGHFSGVATVVARLFNMVQPDTAVFGEKDFQQLAVIRRMVRDLALPIVIEGVATEREPDGLAMSSRNQYLGAEERKQAPQMYAALRAAARALESGARDYAGLEAAGLKALENAGFRPEYFSIREAISLAPARTDGMELVVLAAGRLGGARLIDNIRVRPGLRRPATAR